MTPTRPALRWFGGKWRLAPWVIEHFPHHDAYVEPYGGAASVLLRKPPAKLETWNDLHGRLVNFFTVLRSQADELVAALRLTPYARAEYDQAHSQHPDPFEDARRFYVLSGQGRGGSTAQGRAAGWRSESAPTNPTGGMLLPAYEFASIEHLHAVAARFKRVQIEHGQASAVIARYDRPGTLHYVDPPYWDPAANLQRRYGHTMSEADHVALAECLTACAGMVVLSGRPGGLYEELYGGWSRIDREGLTDSGRMAAESLWLNPAATAAQRQQNLFVAPSTP